MKLLNNIKQKLGKRVLNNKLRNFTRQRKSYNFDSAKSAGILFTPTDQVSFEQIKQFLNYLSTYKLQIYVLGYIDAKTIPESFLFWKGINLFSRKELGWTLVPKTHLVTDFIDKQFDLLFDLSMSDFFPVEYISRLSKSKFKIGRYTLNHGSFDLMFELNNSNQLEVFLDHIKHYLNLINK